MKYGKALLFITLGLLTAFLSVNASGALNNLSVNRTSTSGSINVDSNGTLALINFNNVSYDISNSFTTVGTITNQSIYPLSIMMQVAPTITMVNNNNYILTVSFGTQQVQFTRTSLSAKWTGYVNIAAGASLNVQAKMQPSNGCTANVSFSFESSQTGNIYVYLTDTPTTRRAHSYR